MVRRFVVVMLGAWAAFAAWTAWDDGLWMRWLLVIFLLWTVSFVGRSNDSGAATLLPPAAMGLSFGLDALHAEDLAVATLCLLAFFAILVVVLRRMPRPE